MSALISYLYNYFRSDYAKYPFHFETLKLKPKYSVWEPIMIKGILYKEMQDENY